MLSYNDINTEFMFGLQKDFDPVAFLPALNMMTLELVQKGRKFLLLLGSQDGIDLLMGALLQCLELFRFLILRQRTVVHDCLELPFTGLEDCFDLSHLGVGQAKCLDELLHVTTLRTALGA